MQPYDGALDAHTAHARLSATVYRHAVGHIAAVYDAAREPIVAAGHVDGVEGVLASQPYDSLLLGPFSYGLDACEVGQHQLHTLLRVGGREDGVRHAVGAVGEEDGAVGVAVDDVLQRVGHIGLSVIADEVGHRHVVLVVLLLCLALGMGEHGACDEHDEQCGDGQHGGP